MKRVMFATMLAAFAAASVAAEQQPAPQQPAPQPASQQPTSQPSTTGQRRSGARETQPAGAMNLGTVRISRRVTADGKPLAAGSYQLRLTADEAKPEVPGQDEKLERWVEFLQRGQVRGREVVTIVPQDTIASVAEGRPPRPGTSKVELLKGNDYLRVWINRGGTHYLIHLPTGASATN